jgi:hypothetical protein
MKVRPGQYETIVSGIIYKVYTPHSRKMETVKSFAFEGGFANYFLHKLKAGPFVFLLATGAMAGETNSPGTYPSVSRGESRSVFGHDPTVDFTAFDLRYQRQAAHGQATPCSRQIFLEARWLTFYSAQWDQIGRRLRDLREM